LRSFSLRCFRIPSKLYTERHCLAWLFIAILRQRRFLLFFHQTQNPADEFRFSLCIGRAVFRKFRGQRFFERGIFGGGIGMRIQIIPEADLPVKIGIALLINMDVVKGNLISPRSTNSRRVFSAFCQPQSS